MAEDFHDKTEEPTPKKLADARTKGYVAKSQDLITSLHLIMCILVFFFFAGFMFRKIAALNAAVFLNLNFNFADLNILKSMVNAGLLEMLHTLLPLFVVVIVISFVMNILQTGFIFSSYPLTPKWNKLNIFNTNNYEHNFGSPAIVRLGFGITRLQIVLLLSWLVPSQEAFHIFSLGKGTAQDMLVYIKKIAILVSLGIAVGYLFIAVGDFFYQKWAFNRKMRMSKREVKDELKQTEGDVNIKIKIRSSMRAKAQANAINQLPKADLLITDGSIYAVALAYKHNKMPVPLCLCKGAQSRAAVIKELALGYSIPILDNPSLARKLFREVDSGSYITPEFYKDVASALAQVE
jgi:flagellar biosynthesis protein FlhB